MGRVGAKDNFRENNRGQQSEKLWVGFVLKNTKKEFLLHSCNYFICLEKNKLAHSYHSALKGKLCFLWSIWNSSATSSPVSSHLQLITNSIIYGAKNCSQIIILKLAKEAINFKLFKG
jgi:hypothetical protein